MPPAVAAPARRIALEQVHNLRDLGGYRTADGRETRWRTLFRADSLHRLTGDDLDHVRALGLHTVIDLRSTHEIEARGRFPLAQHPVHYHHLPMLDVSWDPAEAPALESSFADFLYGKYREMLADADVVFASAFHRLALPGALPAVFHCAAGKDRTGVLAALVLSSIGVPDDVVVADYALTGEAMARMRAWALAASPEIADAMFQQPAAFLAADPEAMRRVLATLRERHGSVREYVHSIGVTHAVLWELEDALLSPAAR